MKILFVLVSLLFVRSYCFASGPEILEGEFRAGKNVYLMETHTWEKGDWSSPEGIARRDELKKAGHVCYRKNPKQFVCHQKIVGGEVSEDIKNYLADYLKNFKIDFVGPFAEPKEVINTSTEQEWWIGGKIIINNVKLPGIKWVHQFEPHNDLVVLPVSDEQPVPWFVFKSRKLLHLPLQLGSKKGGLIQKVYRLEADFVAQ